MKQNYGHQFKTIIFKHTSLILGMLFGLLSQTILILLFSFFKDSEFLQLNHFNQIGYFGFRHLIELILGIPIFGFYWFVALLTASYFQPSYKKIIVLFTFLCSLPFLLIPTYFFSVFLAILTQSFSSLFINFLNIFVVANFVLASLLTLFPILYIISSLTTLVGSLYLGFYFWQKRKKPIYTIYFIFLFIIAILSVVFFRNDKPSSISIPKNQYEWISKPHSIIGGNLRALQIFAESDNISTYEPMGWLSNEIAIYKEINVKTGNSTIYSYNVQSHQKKPYVGSEQLYIENCLDGVPEHRSIPDLCLSESKNASGLNATFNKVLLSPDKKWALFGIAYADTADIIAVKKELE